VNFALEPVDLGFVRLAGGGIAPYQSLSLVDEVRPATIMSLVCEGSVVSHGELAERGDLMVHVAHRPFSEVAEGPGLHVWLAFQFTSYHPIWSTLARGGVVHPQESLSLREAFDEVFFSETVSSRSAAFFRLLSAVEPLLPKASYGGESRFRDLSAWITRNISADLSRGVLAERAGMHPNSFDRAFRAETGQSSQRYVRSVRLAAVKRFLASTDLTLDAIAFQTGLATAAYLSRWFKCETGQSPNEYRQCVKKTTSSYLETFGSD